MTTQCLEVPQAAYRDLNLCPHCAVTGQPVLLCRLAEGLPMISRSDGETFHLLLADRPLPYPVERASGPTNKISVCFWYTHIRQPKRTLSTIVILAGWLPKHPALFRKLELVADLLTEQLARKGTLAEVYELFEGPAASRAIS